MDPKGTLGRDLQSSPNVFSKASFDWCKKFVDDLRLPYIPDAYKVFDVSKVVTELSLQGVGRDSKILDLGAWRSATLWALHNLEFRNLYGVDLNPDVLQMPYNTEIHYQVADATETHFPTSFFDVCIAMSVVEHIPRLESFFKECSRILKPGGLLLITTDFSYSKIKTGMKLFGTPWNIFDLEEVKRLADQARSAGFRLISKIPEEAGLNDHPVHFKGKDYTFIYLAFKLEKESVGGETSCAVLCPASFAEQDGISEYSKLLARRLGVTLYRNPSQVPSSIRTVIVETDSYVLSDFQSMKMSKEMDWLIDCHSLNEKMIRWLNKNKLRAIVRNAWLVQLTESRIMEAKYLKWLRFIKRRGLKRAPGSSLEWWVDRMVWYLARITSPRLRNFVVAPHVLYDFSPLAANSDDLMIGSFGFALPYKNFDRIVEVATRLKIRARIVATISGRTNGDAEQSLEIASKLGSLASPDIEIITGYFTESEIASLLAPCSHLMFAQRNELQTSGSMRFAYQLGKPVIAIDSFQAKEAGVHRIHSFSEVDRRYLDETRHVRISMDDGLPYYEAILSSTKT